MRIQLCLGWQCSLWSPLCRLNGGRCASDTGLRRNFPLPSKCEEPQRKGTWSALAKHCWHSHDLHYLYWHQYIKCWINICFKLPFNNLQSGWVLPSSYRNLRQKSRKWHTIQRLVIFLNWFCAAISVIVITT